MTNEEAIEILENGAWWDMVGAMSCDSDASVKLHAALDAAISALRTPQTPAKLDRSRWEGCICCTRQSQVRARERHGYRYCEHCGRPLTEAAWAELERRVNGGTTD